MIEKMKMIYIVSSASDKEHMLESLRELGLLHLADKRAPNRVSIEHFESISKTLSYINDYMPDKKSKDAIKSALLSDEAFDDLYKRVQDAIERKTTLEQLISSNNTEIERIAAWGDFSPEDIEGLKASGYDIHFYTMGRNEYSEAMANQEIHMVRLKSIEKQETVAVIGRLPTEIPAQEFALPRKSLGELECEIESARKEISSCEELFRQAATYEKSFLAHMLKAQNEEDFSSASETTVADDGLVWISGYMPEADVARFKEVATNNSWAYAIDDVSDEDEVVPTKLKLGKVDGLIRPVLDMLGIIPGYREPDISLWFLLFFILFFAMIIGDGAYGVLILIATIILSTKKKPDTTIYLLYVLSIGTIAWGAVTGTWFGLEAAMNVPFLKAMVIPQFANYPEYFGVTATAQQNAIMKFSFCIGAIQMALGSLISVKRKLEAKDLSFVADIGWIISIIAMYLMSLYLVIGEKLAFEPIVAMIIVAFVMVIVFGGMAPGVSFSNGLKAGLGNIFTEFLNTISCFGNVMSYIRLFAVGMAGLAISQSFNDLAGGFTGPLVIVAIILFIIGHALNIVMCFLSVVVHGVRLNVMEFSGQAGLEWAGIPYEPFKVSDKIRK